MMTNSKCKVTNKNAFSDRFSFQLIYYSYTREIPSRFKKDIVKAATPANSDYIVPGSLSRVLMNIGAENRLTSRELKVIFEELGNGKQISTNTMMQIL
jgi:hypothetical protein